MPALALFPFAGKDILPLLVLLAFGTGCSNIVAEYILVDQVYRSKDVSTEIGVLYIPLRLAEFLFLSLGGLVIADFGYGPPFIFLAMGFFSGAGMWIAIQHGGLQGISKEVLEAAELAGGVPLQRQPGVLRPHPRAVVRHADEAEAALLRLDGDGPGARVERVLHQLLHDRGGPLHDLAGGDLVDEPGGQDLDARHVRGT